MGDPTENQRRRPKEPPNRVLREIQAEPPEFLRNAKWLYRYGRRAAAELWRSGWKGKAALSIGFAALAFALLGEFSFGVGGASMNVAERSQPGNDQPPNTATDAERLEAAPSALAERPRNPREIRLPGGMKVSTFGDVIDAIYAAGDDQSARYAFADSEINGMTLPAAGWSVAADRAVSGLVSRDRDEIIGFREPRYGATIYVLGEGDLCAGIDDGAFALVTGRLAKASILIGEKDDVKIYVRGTVAPTGLSEAEIKDVETKRRSKQCL